MASPPTICIRLAGVGASGRSPSPPASAATRRWANPRTVSAADSGAATEGGSAARVPVLRALSLIASELISRLSG